MLFAMFDYSSLLIIDNSSFFSIESLVNGNIGAEKNVFL